ncbi:MAG: rhomboid family intramembrane serine protease [Alphaproteobacteria bacterium]
MSLNHILLFLAIVSPLLVLARAWRPGMPYHGWRFAALVVLVATGIAWFLWSDVAGYIGGTTWFLLLFLPAIGLRRMTRLASQGDYKSAANLGVAVQILHPSDELREQVQLFRRLESNPALRTNFRPVFPSDEIATSASPDQVQITPAVLIIILVNGVVFLFEMYAGGWNDPVVLHRIGALEPYAVVGQGEYWRLFTALFLHGGFLHLGFNLFALYILGPPLERAIGTWRFATCYLLSGLGSSAGVVALSEMGLVEVAQIIGASGCIMGVVGTWAGFLLRNRHAPLAKQRLANIALIVAIQVAFDLSTPQVSMAAHMCGLLTGFLLGLILGRQPGTVAGEIAPGGR